MIHIPKNLYTATISLFLLSSVYASSGGLSEIPVTRWVDPTKSNPMTFEEYISAKPYSNIVIEREYRIEKNDSAGKVAIIINSALADMDAISESFNQYIDDLYEGDFTVVVYEVSGGFPSELKGILQDEWDETFKGAILIGELPVPWFEMEEDFGKDSGVQKDWVQFPCDLYYMDLDGTWSDENSNGVFDAHTGSWQPEIYIGNLFAYNLSWNEAQIIKNYLERNHRYRWRELEKVGAGLSYCDDDWTSWAVEWAEAAEAAFDNIINISNINTTNAGDYKSRLPNAYDLVQTFVHSWPQGHSFKIINGTNWDYMYSSELNQVHPNSLFYNLFACSNSRYVESDYMGGCYLFASADGLGVLGSTKTGSMLYFQDFYNPLSNGQTFGDAFKQWFSLHGQEPGSVTWSMSWFYGMTYLGDPTLMVDMPVMYQNGDPNNDHLINVLDIVIMIQIILEQLVPTDEEFRAADINDDDVVNIQDIVISLNIILGINN